MLQGSDFCLSLWLPCHNPDGSSSPSPSHHICIPASREKKGTEREWCCILRTHPKVSHIISTYISLAIIWSHSYIQLQGTLGNVGWACAWLEFCFPVTSKAGENNHWRTSSSLCPPCLQANIVWTMFMSVLQEKKCCMIKCLRKIVNYISSLGESQYPQHTKF